MKVEINVTVKKDELYVPSWWAYDAVSVIQTLRTQLSAAAVVWPELAECRVVRLPEATDDHRDNAPHVDAEIETMGQAIHEAVKALRDDSTAPIFRIQSALTYLAPWAGATDTENKDT